MPKLANLKTLDSMESKWTGEQYENKKENLKDVITVRRNKGLD